MTNLAQPLHWRKPTDHPQDPSGKLVADGLGGRYSIQEESGIVYLWWAHDNFLFEKCASIDEAKAKAEQDWQERYAGKRAWRDGAPCFLPCQNGACVCPASYDHPTNRAARVAAFEQDQSPERLLARCMGGKFCAHSPGTCTATLKAKAHPHAG